MQVVAQACTTEQQLLKRARLRVWRTGACCVAFLSGLAILSWLGGSCGTAYTGFNFKAMRNKWVQQPAATMLLAYQVISFVLLVASCHYICFRLLPLLHTQHPVARQETLLQRDRSSSMEFMHFMSRRSSRSQDASPPRPSSCSIPGDRAGTRQHTGHAGGSCPVAMPAGSGLDQPKRRVPRLHSGAVAPVTHNRSKGDVVQAQRASGSEQSAWQPCSTAQAMPAHEHVHELLPCRRSTSSVAAVALAHDPAQCHPNCTAVHVDASNAALALPHNGGCTDHDTLAVEHTDVAFPAVSAHPMHDSAPGATVQSVGSSKRTRSPDSPSMHQLVQIYRRVVQFARSSNEQAGCRAAPKQHRRTSTATSFDFAASCCSHDVHCVDGDVSALARTGSGTLSAEARCDVIAWLTSLHAQLYGSYLHGGAGAAMHDAAPGTRGHSRWGWQAKLGVIDQSNSRVTLLVQHPWLVQQVFDDASSVFFLYRRKRKLQTLHLQCVPLWMWLETERCALGLLSIAGVFLPPIKECVCYDA